MATPHLGKLEPFRTIGLTEIAFARSALDMPLSGYIGGNYRGGRWVEHLASEWSRTFGRKYSIPCNSATSGLLAACMAVGIRPGDEVWTTPYSMSATAACAKVLGANLRFIDIEPEHFGIDPTLLNADLAGRSIGETRSRPKAIIVTNLFGYPAKLHEIRAWCDAHDVYMIEDNAQAPMALAKGRYSGTIGHIGVFSLNVHKHIQCGEGGVVVANHETAFYRLYGAINHGELHPAWAFTGLNLRMTEPIAAIACAQLAKAEKIIEGRREIGLELSDMVADIPWLKARTEHIGYRHSYYLWTALAANQDLAAKLVYRLNKHGVPIRHRYAPLLHQLFNSGDKCPVVEDVDSRIIVFEVCAYDLKQRHLDTMREIFKRATGELDEPTGQRLPA